MAKGEGFDGDLWQEMCALGWPGITIAEEFGGVGLSLAEAAMIAEQMGRRLLASPFNASIMAAALLEASGNENAQKTWLPKIAEGAVVALALYEEGGDWALDNVTAQLTPSGAGWTLSGQKFFVRDADKAALIIATVKSDKGVQLALINCTEQGDIADKLRREKLIDERLASYALSLDGVTLPENALLSMEQSAAALAAMEQAAFVLQSAEMCGGIQGVMDYTLDYLRTRSQFGKIIGAYQALKHPMVNIYADYEKSRSHMLSAAYAHGQDSGEKLAVIAAHMAKAFADKVYHQASDRAIQFHGAFGFTHECDAQLYRRNAIYQSSQFGDASWHKQKLAGLLF